MSIITLLKESTSGIPQKSTLQALQFKILITGKLA